MPLREFDQVEPQDADQTSPNAEDEIHRVQRCEVKRVWLRYDDAPPAMTRSVGFPA